MELTNICIYISRVKNMYKMYFHSNSLPALESQPTATIQIKLIKTDKNRYKFICQFRRINIGHVNPLTLLLFYPSTLQNRPIHHHQQLHYNEQQGRDDQKPMTSRACILVPAPMTGRTISRKNGCSILLRLSPQATNKDALAIMAVTVSAGMPAPYFLHRLDDTGAHTANSPPALGMAKIDHCPVI